MLVNAARYINVYVGVGVSKDSETSPEVRDMASGSFNLYDDDGVSFNFEKGEYSLKSIVVVCGKKALAISTRSHGLI